MDFPGGSVPFTSALTMVGGPDAPPAPMPCYRTIDSAGADIPDAVIPYPVGAMPSTNIHLYAGFPGFYTLETLM